MDDIQFSREFQWEHCTLDGEKAIKLYTTNTFGDEVQLLLDGNAMRDLLEEIKEYLDYLEE